MTGTDLTPAELAELQARAARARLAARRAASRARVSVVLLGLADGIAGIAVIAGQGIGTPALGWLFTVNALLLLTWAVLR